MCGAGSAAGFVADTLAAPSPCLGDPLTGDHLGSSPLGRSPCGSLAFAWAMGGGPIVLPASAGLRLDVNALRWLVLEIHYDNPGHVAGIVDNSGVRLHLTDVNDLRPH